MNTSATGRRKSSFMACAISKVQTVYMPSGNTALQNTGSYLSGNFLKRCRHTTRIISSGIHQVPAAQKKIVNPVRKGTIDSRNHASVPFSIKSDPASVEIAIAPMLIQYEGTKSAGANLKNM